MSKTRLKNNMIPIRKTVLGLWAAVVLSVPAHGQINVDQLNPASVYDAGVIQDGGLGSGLSGALWQGVSARQATNLIENIDTHATGSARRLNRAALLSGGIPPQAVDRYEREAYIAARLSAVLALGNFSDFDTLVNRSDINRSDPVYAKIFVERALLGADTQATTQTACAITDNITIERKSPYWAKLRAFCHLVRGEIPAAELTVDLLVRSGYKDDSFFSLLGTLITPRKTNFAPDIIKTPLDTALARLLFEKKQISAKVLSPILTAEIAVDGRQEQTDRLAALLASAHLLDANQIRSVLAGYTDTPQELAEILAQADEHGQLPAFARALEADTKLITAQEQTKLNAVLFARAAVLRDDTVTLRELFQVLDSNDPLRMRIALAADALNNGFVFGELGIDMETRLAGAGKTQTRAVRDAYIAVAMGANLSSEAETVLRETKLTGRILNPGVRLALQGAARRGSKAEIALRVAHMIDGEPLRADAFAALLSAFVSVGMHEQAGRLAALDILAAQ